MKKIISFVALFVFLCSAGTVALAATGTFTDFIIHDDTSHMYSTGVSKNLGSGWEMIAYITLTATDQQSNETCQLRVRDSSKTYATNYVQVRALTTYHPGYLSTALATETTKYYLWGSCTSPDYHVVTVSGRWTP